MIYLLTTKFLLRVDAERKVVEHASVILPERELTEEQMGEIFNPDSSEDVDDSGKKTKDCITFHDGMNIFFGINKHFVYIILHKIEFC